MIDIVGKNKAKILAELYNNSKPLGLGYFQFDPSPMTENEALEILKEMEKIGDWYIDYLKGRVMKVNFEGNQLDPWGYDRDNGQGAMGRIVENI